MNKKIIAAMVAAGLVLPAIAANAAETPVVYGKLHLNLGSYDDNGSAADNWRLESFASRLGFKGKKQLNAGLTGTYKFETEVAVESGTTTFAGRNTYLGLKGGFGEVRFGRHDSPLKMAQGKFDQFNDTMADLKHVGSHDGENRNTNAITYLGKFDKLGVNVQLIPGEGNGTTAGQGLTDTTSIAISYKSGPLYLAVANDAYDRKTGTGSESGLTRFVATYKTGAMQFGLLSQSGVEKIAASTAKEDWLGLSFNMKIGSANKLKAQYITTKNHAATPEEGKLLAVGFDHKLGKKGTVYVMYSNLDFTTNANDTTSVSAGYVLNF